MNERELERGGGGNFFGLPLDLDAFADRRRWYLRQLKVRETAMCQLVKVGDGNTDSEEKVRRV
jgi:hypothetical protein